MLRRGDVFLINNEIILLSDFLRNENMPVSIRSTMIAEFVLKNFRNKMTFDEFYLSLKSIYVKDIEDNDKFDRAFNKVFKKIDVKTEETEEGNDEQGSPEEASYNPMNDVVAQPDLEQLQQLYDMMMKDGLKQDSDYKKMLDGSLILLDSWDPRVFELCRRLSKKIANKRSKRRKKYNSHHINMSKTLRSNLKNGGHFIKIYYDKPPKKKSKHVFLCDVSGSCEWITSWFFLLLYGCKRTFNKVSIYDFDNEVTDVTDVLEVESYKSVGEINVAQRAKGIRCYGQSDMAKAFREFLDMAEINSRTDIIILSDCRDWKGKHINGILESASLIKTMLSKANRVIILNPEKRIRWNNATSYVKEYEKAGAEVFEVSSLHKFEQVITEL